MDDHTSYEQAYKNGYDKGYADGKMDAVKKGRWATSKRVAFSEECSVCGGYVFWDECGCRHEYNYCPHCGADMRGEEDV